MQAMTKQRHMDMLNGPLWSKLPRYALPVAATGILGQLFNAADVAVVGNFTGELRTVAVAAVGANSPVIGLLLNLFIGIALGAMPMKRLTMRPMIGPFAPTAATATVRASPVKLPTMATSEAWKSCSKIAVAATGRAKSGSLFQMEPCSMSISCFLTVVPMISLISFCFPLNRAPV